MLPGGVHTMCQNFIFLFLSSYGRVGSIYRRVFSLYILCSKGSTLSQNTPFYLTSLKSSYPSCDVLLCCNGITILLLLISISSSFSTFSSRVLLIMYNKHLSGPVTCHWQHTCMNIELLSNIIMPKIRINFLQYSIQYLKQS